MLTDKQVVGLNLTKFTTFPELKRQFYFLRYSASITFYHISYLSVAFRVNSHYIFRSRRSHERTSAWIPGNHSVDGGLQTFWCHRFSFRISCANHSSICYLQSRKLRNLKYNKSTKKNLHGSLVLTPRRVRVVGSIHAA